MKKTPQKKEVKKTRIPKRVVDEAISHAVFATRGMLHMPTASAIAHFLLKARF